LVSDGIVHLNVVLANGSEIAVNEECHPDLFWAMRGAGHNFGIVTSMKVKIYPRPTNTWHFHSYIWTQDKLETVFEELNKLHEADNGTTPPLMAFEQGLIIMNASISETEVIILHCPTWHKHILTLYRPFYRGLSFTMALLQMPKSFCSPLMISALPTKRFTTSHTLKLPHLRERMKVGRPV
jgi:hypothetical protein